jgi:hypothetical protein
MNLSEAEKTFGPELVAWTRRQVEGHLVVGSLLKTPRMNWALPGLVILCAIVMLVCSSKNIGDIIQSLFFIFVVIYFAHRLSKYAQAVILWFAVKLTITIVSVIAIFVGGFINWLDGRPALINALLGFIWLPGLEYFPRMMSRQKYITGARFILSIPLIYIGFKTGLIHR